MSFICVICRDLLKISEEASSPRHQHLPQNNQNIANNHASPTSANNVSSGRRKGKNNSIVATKCGHLFHYPCLSAWLSQSMNLTADSKMRCPSCKQLIYIYELIQLFPVENGCGSGSNGNLPTTFQQRMKTTVERLEKLVMDLGKKNGDSNGSCLPETPTKLYCRSKDSPKKMHAAQLAELLRELDSLRGSILDLNVFIEQHAKLGREVEKQTQEITELKSQNEELLLANERLKLPEITESEKEKSDKTTAIVKSRSDCDPSNKIEQSVEIEKENENITEKVLCVEDNETSGAAQDLNIPPDGQSQTQTVAAAFRDSYVPVLKSSPVPARATTGSGNPRRKSVSFVDPFDEFDEETTLSTSPSIPFDKKDLRVGDKVIWNFEGNPELGVVKWKGFVGSQIHVGIEFERQLGLPIKDHSSDALQCIFKSKPGHGRLIPVDELTLFCKNRHNNGFPKNVHCDFKPEGGNGVGKRIQVCTHQ